MLLSVLLAGLFAIVTESVLSYFLLVRADEKILFLILVALGTLLFILFKQVLVVHNETITLYKFFKRKRTIHLKNAERCEKTVDGKKGNYKILIIRGGDDEIDFCMVSDKNIQMLKRLCKTARECLDSDNLTD